MTFFSSRVMPPVRTRFLCDSRHLLSPPRKGLGCDCQNGCGNLLRRVPSLGQDCQKTCLRWQRCLWTHDFRLMALRHERGELDSTMKTVYEQRSKRKLIHAPSRLCHRCHDHPGVRRRAGSPFFRIQNHGQNDHQNGLTTLASRSLPGPCAREQNPHDGQAGLNEAGRGTERDDRTWVSRLQSQAPPAMWAGKCSTFWTSAIFRFRKSWRWLRAARSARKCRSATGR